MFKGHRTASPPQPGRECASFAPLLPVLDDLSTDEAARTRSHLAECAYCRSQRAFYDLFDEALLRHLNPEAAPYISTERLMQSIDQSIDDDFARTSLDPQNDTPPAPVVIHSAPRTPRHVFSALATLAAVLLLAVTGSLVFLSHGQPDNTSHLGTSRTPAGTPGGDPNSAINAQWRELLGVGMTSPEDGWAIEFTANPSEYHLLHIVSGKVAEWINPQEQLNAIAMVNDHDGWVAGANGAIWRYGGPAAGWGSSGFKYPNQQITFTTIDAVSENDIWFGGSYTTYPNGYTKNVPYIAHFNGREWLYPEIAAPKGDPTQSGISMVNTTVTGISMVSPDEGWAVGNTQTAVDTQGNTKESGAIWHYTGGKWQLVQQLPDANLSAISMVSATNGWIGGLEWKHNTVTNGYQGPTTTSIPALWHFDGASFTPVAVAQPDGGAYALMGRVGQIHMLSATDGWMVGGAYDAKQSLSPTGNGDVSPYLFHYDGTRWSRVDAPTLHDHSIAALTAVSFISENEFIAVGHTYTAGVSTRNGEKYTNPQYSSNPFVLHYKNGAWTYELR